MRQILVPRPFRSILVLVLWMLGLHAGTLVEAADTTPPDPSGQRLALQRGGRISVGPPDGKEMALLTPGWAGGTQYHPDWSPDATRVAFSADDQDQTRDIWIADALSGKSTRIYDCAAPCVWSDDPAWSPDGASLAFERVLPNAAGLSDSQLIVLDLTTGEDVLVWSVTHPNETIYVPRWSPDATRMVIELDRFIDASIDATEVVGSSIAVINLNTGSATPLTTIEDFATYPDWSASGDSIVFARSGSAGTTGPYEIYTIAPDGTGLTQLTSLGPDGFQGIQPSFTPDGSSVIFVKDQMWNGNAVVATIALSPGAGVEITRNPTNQEPISGTHPRLSG